jgi:hypothetical protein
MTEHQPYESNPDESFATLHAVQEGLARRGFLFCPIPLEHTEALVTGPLIHRIRTQIRKRGFTNVATRVVLTFSGFATDEREVFAIPEIRAYYRALDAQLPELPALPAFLPQLKFNGPGLHLLLLGHVDTMLPDFDKEAYDVKVNDAPRLVDDALQRIRRAGQTYHLPQETVTKISDHFLRGVRFRL